MADQGEAAQQDELTEVVADIVSAYVSNNPVQIADLSDLIGSVHRSMAALASGNGVAPAGPPTPAVSVKSSIKKDAIACLECGKKFKSLKRHISTHHGLSPDEYREKWGLPADYPMVAPEYAAARSQLAMSMGLGRKPKAAKAKRDRKS